MMSISCLVADTSFKFGRKLTYKKVMIGWAKMVG